MIVFTAHSERSGLYILTAQITAGAVTVCTQECRCSCKCFVQCILTFFRIGLCLQWYSDIQILLTKTRDLLAAFLKPFHCLLVKCRPVSAFCRRMQHHHKWISCIGCIDDKVKPIPFPMKQVIGFIITQSGSHGNLLIIFNLLFLIHFSPILCNKKLVIALKRYENHTFPFYTLPCQHATLLGGF